MTQTPTTELLSVVRAMRDYIDALPSDVVASLPTMPGFDRDWADEVIEAANRAAQPVAWRYRTTDINGNPNPRWSFSEEASLMGLYQPLYTAPPAPAVPEEKAPKDFLFRTNANYQAAVYVAEGWNACRAAMLAQPVSQGCNWIACSEKMPETNKYVQVSNGVWVGIGMYNDAEHFEDDERWQDEHNEFIDLLHHPVTHWMPLPAAPEGGNDA